MALLWLRGRPAAGIHEGLVNQQQTPFGEDDCGYETEKKKEEQASTSSSTSGAKEQLQAFLELVWTVEVAALLPHEQ